ncbi:MAG: DegT/DnrJ/EryC1/StrS family aminotransferase [Leptospirales bacterium]|nr:DegT/DnrJ/EryC1/StrS family aminotransferase [Leptospirales bacterium]
MSLALFGGSPTIATPPRRYTSIGPEEVKAAVRVVESGNLSQYVGCWDPDFYGGPNVRALESEWASYFKSGNAIAVNSNTSGLMAALGALNLEPGDEVIVSPWTMSASATAILVWNAIPVFADIELETFNLDPASVAARITPLTRAIVVTDLFGHPARLSEIMEIARGKGIRVIEDCAQAPGAMYAGKFVGTVADAGVFSLNYHKHIHTGEGGVVVTDNAEIAERIQLIRNHAESVVADKGVSLLTNMIGFNFRMTEVEAAIAREQLLKLSGLVKSRMVAAERLTSALRDLPGLKPPFVRPGSSHVYYVYAMQYDSSVTGVSRSRLIEALNAEGVDISAGYLNLHLLPMYQKRIAYGSAGFPWTGGLYRGTVSYDKGICPQAERAHESTVLKMEFCKYVYDDETIDRVAAAFRKVWDHLPSLKDL